MPRTYRSRKGNGERIPLGEFSEPITVLRVGSTPSAEDESWVRKALKVGNFEAAYEPGEVKNVKGEKVSQSEHFLFVIPHDPAYDFTVADYVVYGSEVFHVQSYSLPRYGNRQYFQLNTLPWGKVDATDWTLDANAPVPPATEEKQTGNLFWNS